MWFSPAGLGHGHLLAPGASVSDPTNKISSLKKKFWRKKCCFFFIYGALTIIKENNEVHKNHLSHWGNSSKPPINVVICVLIFCLEKSPTELLLILRKGLCPWLLYLAWSQDKKLPIHLITCYITVSKHLYKESQRKSLILNYIWKR